VLGLLGCGGGHFFVLGMLVWSASSYLTLSDPTGSVRHNMADAHPAPDNADLIFTPGMFIIINGEYSMPKRPRGRRAAPLAASAAATSVLENSGGIGGTIAGKFICTTVLSPPAEPHHAMAHLSSGASGGELRWLDPLGVGSARCQHPHAPHRAASVAAPPARCAQRARHRPHCHPRRRAPRLP
jgi:DNA polymerase epsilon subunit 2